MEERTVRIPGQKPHVIQVTQGSNPNPQQRPAGDSTVHFNDSVAAQQAERDARREGRGGVSEIRTGRVANPANAVMIGGFTLRPNPIAGTTEASFTLGGADSHQVLDAEGDPMSAHAGLAAIYAVLFAEQQAARRAEKAGS